MKHFLTKIAALVKKPKRKTVIGIIAATLAAAVLAVTAAVFLPPVYHYYAAQNHIKKEEYTDAYFHLLKCRGFMNVKTLLKDFSVEYQTHTQRIIYYDKDGNITNRQAKAKVTYRYHDNGQLAEEIQDRLNEKVVQEFTRQGDQTKYVVYDKDGTVSTNHTYVYSYDGNDLLLEQAYYDDNELANRWIYEYDSTGNQIGAVYCRADGTWYYRYTYEYDSAGNKICETEYSDESGLVYKHIYSYDSNGNMIQKLTYDRHGDLMLNFAYCYDENGYRTQTIRYDEEGGIFFREVFAYDEYGNQTLYADYKADDKLSYMYEYTLDEEGNCTYVTHYDEDGVKTGYLAGKYTYDRYGIALTTTLFNENGTVSSETEVSKDYKSATKTEYQYSRNEAGERYISYKTITEQTDPVVFYHPREDK